MAFSLSIAPPLLLLGLGLLPRLSPTAPAISVFGPEYIGDDPITVGQGVWGQANGGMVLILQGTGSDTGVYNVYFPWQNIRINSSPIGR